MKDIIFKFENEEDYTYFINNVLNSFGEKNGVVIQDENTIQLLIRNIKHK